MAWFRRRRSARTEGGAAVADRAATKVDRDHLTQFIETRSGVEGFVEPPTTVSSVTLLLVAKDGEWTRRRVPSAQWAHEFANKIGVPTYDAGVVGYPQRMRDWNHAKTQAEKERRRSS